MLIGGGRWIKKEYLLTIQPTLLYCLKALFQCVVYIRVLHDAVKNSFSSTKGLDEENILQKAFWIRFEETFSKNSRFLFKTLYFGETKIL